MAASSSRFPLLCLLGRHKPRPLARWNHGYYFTSCERCGLDLVRTAFSGWHEPRGYRVVWQAQPPARAVPAALERAGAQGAPPSGEELPIQEVIRHVQNGDRVGEAPAPVVEDDPAAPDEEIEPERDPDPDPAEVAVAAAPSSGEPEALVTRAVPAPRIPDFMADDAAGAAWDLPPSRNVVRAEHAGAPDAGAGGEEAPGQLARLAARLTPLLGGARRERPPETAADTAAPGSAGRAVPSLSLALILAVVAIAAIFLWIGRVGNLPGRSHDVAARGVPLAPESGQPAFVTASLLNCRSAPAQQANPVAVLNRGDGVRLLARDGDWASLVHQGGQCWALVRYLALERPI